jgi:hypothetical protein
MAPITSLKQVTPEWLTGRLWENGILSVGRVTSVVQTRIFSNNADSAQLTLCYSADAESHNAPDRLFVKVARPDSPWNHVEHRFYTLVASEMQAANPERTWPFPRCYDAAYEGGAEDDLSTARKPSPKGPLAAHLLLEDLTATHITIAAGGSPTLAQATQAVEGLALFHAYWWEHPRLGRDIGQKHTAGSIERMIDWAAGNYAAWVDSMGDRLTIRRRRLLDTVFHAWPQRRVDHLVGEKGITLVHRDTHPLNLLYPRVENAGMVRIVDWQSWRVDTGTDDLAYMMACHWHPDDRIRLERPLLQRYRSRLRQEGVKEYSWEQCWYDYRASVIRCLFFLLGSWHPGRPAAMWSDRLEKGLIAFQDLNCSELLP